MSVIFLIPYINHPSGGINTIFNMSSTLTKNNIHNYMMYIDTNNKNDNVRPFNMSDITPSDIFVIPETLPDIVKFNLPKNNRKIIFNQNLEYTINPVNPLKININEIYEEQYNVTDIICVSKHNYHKIKEITPHNINIQLFNHYINDNIFNFNRNKKIQIACMPQKGTSVILNTIFSANVPAVLIQGASQKNVAQILKESLIFLCWSDLQEGFFLPPAEAMACGCAVIGNTPGGAIDFMKPEYCYPVHKKENINNIIKYVLEQYNENPYKILCKTRIASDFILNTYNYKEYENTILKIWHNILE